MSYGKEIIYRTHAKTVGEVLAEKNISLAENDIVAPAKMQKSLPYGH